MEIKEAIEGFEIDNALLRANENESGVVERNKIAIEALEKQMPKKPEEQRYFRTFNSYAGLCPSCRGGANSEFKYCGDCGQKLDWES